MVFVIWCGLVTLHIWCSVWTLEASPESLPAKNVYVLTCTLPCSFVSCALWSAMLCESFSNGVVS